MCLPSIFIINLISLLLLDIKLSPNNKPYKIFKYILFIPRFVIIINIRII
jgi:hypothetical protein